MYYCTSTVLPLLLYYYCSTAVLLMYYCTTIVLPLYYCTATVLLLYYCTTTVLEIVVYDEHCPFYNLVCAKIWVGAVLVSPA